MYHGEKAPLSAAPAPEPTVGRPEQYRLLEDAVDDIAKAVLEMAEKFSWDEDDFLRMVGREVDQLLGK